jgi:hypothetical protein
VGFFGARFDGGVEDGRSAPPQRGEDFAEVKVRKRREADGEIAGADDCRPGLARRFEHSALECLSIIFVAGGAGRPA